MEQGAIVVVRTQQHPVLWGFVMFTCLSFWTLIPNAQSELFPERHHDTPHKMVDPREDQDLQEGERALERAEHTFGAHSLEHAEVALHLAKKYITVRARPHRAEELTQLVLEVYSQEFGVEDPQRASVFELLAESLVQQNRLDEAIKIQGQSLSLHESAYGPNDLRVTLSLTKLAAIYDLQQRVKKADSLYSRGVDIIRHHPDTPHQSAHETILDGQEVTLDELFYLYEQALFVREDLFGSLAVDLVPALLNLASIEVMIDRMESAQRNFLRAYDLLRRNLGEEHPEAKHVLRNIERLFITEALPHKDNSDYWIFLLKNLGEGLTQNKVLDLTAKVYERLLALEKKHYGPNDPTMTTTMMDLARTYGRQGRQVEAAQLYQKTIALLENTVADAQLAKALIGFANLLVVMDDYEKSEATYQQALTLIEQLADQVPQEIYDDVEPYKELETAARAGFNHVRDKRDAQLAEIFVAQARQHDTLLRQVGTLETQLDHSPDELRTLKELLEASVALLGFERGTDLGSNIFLLTSERLEDYQARTSPLTHEGQRFLAQLRATLFMTMRAYPEAMFALDQAGHTPDTLTIRAILEGLGQTKFHEMEQFAVGPLQISAFETQGVSPKPNLLWPKYHLIARRAADAPLHLTIGLTLMQQGEPGMTRYYLFLNSLNRTRLMAIYGTQAPTYESLRHTIQTMLHTILVRGRRPIQ